MNNNKKNKKGKKRVRQPKMQTHSQQIQQNPQNPQNNNIRNVPPNKKVTQPPKRKKKKLFTKKFSELTPKEKEAYLKRKRLQEQKQQKKLRAKRRRNAKKNNGYDGRREYGGYNQDVRRPQANNEGRKLRRHKKRHKKNYTLYYIMFAFFASICLYIMSTTVWFEVEQIEVLGDFTMPFEEIVEVSEIEFLENLVKLNSKSVAKKISAEYVTVETVEIIKKFPNKVQIEVNMAKPKLLLYYDRLYYTLSESNRIIGFATRNYYEDENLITFLGGDLENIDLGSYLKDVNLDLLEDVERLLLAVEENDFHYITHVDLSNISDIRFYVEGLYEIKSGGFSEISYKLHCAKSIIEIQLGDFTQHGIIDVSVDDGIYYFRPSMEIDINF